MVSLAIRANVATGIFAAGGGADPFAVRDPQAGDIFMDLDRATNGTGTFANPYQKSQVPLSIFQSVNGTGQQIVAMNPTGNGTFSMFHLTGMTPGNSANRKVFRTLPGHAKARLNFPVAGCAFGLSYWDIRDFNLNTTGTGIRMGSGSYDGNGDGSVPDVTSTFVRILYCTGVTDSSGTINGKLDDNRGIVVCAAPGGGTVCSDIVIALNDFRGSHSLGGTNRSLVWMDYMRRIQLIGNLLQLSDNPYYFKHSEHTTNVGIDIQVYNNICLNAGRGCMASTNYATFRNNAYFNAKMSIDEDGGSPVPTSHDCIISHCTHFDSDWMNPNLTMTTQNNIMRDNVMLGTTRYGDAPFSGANNGNSIDYSASAGAGTTRYYRNGTVRTMAQYASTYSPNEAHGEAGTLTLVGGSNPGPTPGNWAINVGSVGKGNASDGAVDRGVNAANLLTAN